MTAPDEPANRRDSAIQRARGKPEAATDTDLKHVFDALETDSDPQRQAASMALAAVAAHSPSLLTGYLDRVTPLLDDDDPQVRGMAVKAISDLAAEEPERVVPLLEDLRPLLEVEYHVTRNNTLVVVESLAAHDPESVVDAVPELRTVMTSEGPLEQSVTRALRICYRIARVRPEAVTDAVPALTTVLESQPSSDHDDRNVLENLNEVATKELEEMAVERASARRVAAQLLFLLASERPADLAAYVPSLIAWIDDEDPTVRRTTAGALRSVASEDPEALLGWIDPLVEAIDSVEDESCLASLVQTLSLTTAAAPERVAPSLTDSVDAVSSLHTHEDSAVRAAAVGLLAYIAEVSPTAVDSAISALDTRLEDEDPSVRGQALWAFRFLPEAAPSTRIERMAVEDPDPEIRDLAGTVAGEIDNEAQ